jgi:hypothetical protein
MADSLSGSCLCGAVSFTFTPKEPHADVCHCSMCRTWSSGPAFAIQSDGEPTIDGAENITAFKSSDWGNRHFCKTCGTNLFWTAPDYGYFGVSVGPLKDTSALTFTKQIFIDKKPALYTFADDTKNMTEAEVMAMFAAGRRGGWRWLTPTS